MSERRRRRSIFAAIVDDPWRKLLAVALAVMAWFFVDSRINKEVVRSLPLVAVGEQVSRGAASNQLAVAVPTDRVRALRFYDGEREISEVAVVIRGQRFRIDALEREPWDLQITDLLRLDWTGRTSVEFTAGDLPGDHRLLRDLEITFRPVRIRLAVEQVQQQEFPLALDAIDLVEGPYANRLRRDTAEFSPASATVLGPLESVQRLVARTGRRFRATLEPGANDRQVQAKLELLAEDAPGLRFQNVPSLTVQLLPQTTRFVLELPILVDDLALPPDQRGRYRPDAPTRTVQIAAAGELLSRLVGAGEGERGEAARAAWAAANLRLFVNLQRSETGSYPPELDRPARLVLVDRRLSEVVDRNECLLGETVVVKLRQKP